MTEPQPWPQTVVSDPEIAMGKPVVSGTRIPVALILEKHAFIGTHAEYDRIDASTI